MLFRSRQFDYVAVVGDINTHHKSWLRFSREDTPRGAKLKHVCDTHGLKERVRKPTRGPYLLDLVLTDHPQIDVVIGAKIADHSSLLLHVPDSFEERTMGSRHVWHYRDANWEEMEQSLEHTSWSNLLEGSVDDAVQVIYDVLYVCFESSTCATI